MSGTLLQQALTLAQEGIATFPVNADKRPALKGWRQIATTDEKTLTEWFSGQYAGIGVPCGPDQDLICFDLDFGHTEDPDRRAALSAWLVENEIEALAQNDQLIVRQTRSGGLHVISSWPQGAKPPRRIMPKLDVIIEGFYFVWALNDDSYKHVAGELTSWQPPDQMLRVIEKGAGSDGSALMSSEAAHEVMMSDGDDGQRHDALLRITQDWAAEHPEMTKVQLCESCEAYLVDMYEDQIDPKRFEQLTQWTYDERTGDLGGELGRAMAGVANTPESAGLVIQKAAEKLKAAGQLPLIDAARDSARADAVREAQREQLHGAVVEIDLEELKATELPDVDWIIDDVIPANNLIGLAGPSGAGKTRVIAALVAALCSGRTDLIGLPEANRPIRTLYIANEERNEDLKRRIKAAATANGMQGALHLFVRGKDSGPLKLADADGPADEVIDWLKAFVLEHRIELLIFDPFTTLGVSDENSTEGVDGVMQAFQLLMRHCAVMFVHHTPKGERGAPADDIRGDGGAFRGSGAIFSPLDIAMTLAPYLPPSCHNAQTGRKARRLLGQMQRDKRVPKFIVLDSAKERESEGFPSVYYQLSGHEVREGGKKIGAIQSVPEALAEQTLEGALSHMPDAAIDHARAKLWFEALLEVYPEGVRTGLQQLCDVLDDAQPAGWLPGHGKARKDEGRGKLLLDHLCQPVTVSGVNCVVERNGKGRRQYEFRVTSDA